MAKTKATAKQKAQRRQHRKDHYTDADRKAMKDNKGDQKGRRAARMANFEAQGNKSAADFNFDQHGKGHVGGSEIRHLMNQGQSKEDIMSAARASGGELGRRVEKKFARWEAKAKAKAATGQADAEAIDPNQPANEQSQNTNIENSQEQTVVQDNDQSSTIVGDNNTVEQNQDNSVGQLGSNNKSMVGQSSGSGDNEMSYIGGTPGFYDKGGPGSSDAEANKLKNSYIDTIRPGTTSKMDTAIKNTQKQDIAQDNDQTSTITGDNNTVWQQQDNSIRQYGGDNRSFVYQGGNSGVDTPVSAATMAGFYDVDDSPAAQAKFHDLHNTLNNDAQKRYQGMGMKTASMFTNFDARGYDPAVLEDNLKQDEQRSYDRSTLAKLDAFGDRDAYRGTLSEYKFGAEPKAVNYGDDDDDDDD